MCAYLKKSEREPENGAGGSVVPVHGYRRNIRDLIGTVTGNKSNTAY